MADLEGDEGWEYLAQADGAGTREGGAAPEAGTAANRPPQAADVCVATAEDAAVNVPILEHVRDPDGDPLQLLAATDPTSGQVFLNPDGTVTYTPAAPGLRSFQYQVSDGQGGVAAWCRPLLRSASVGESPVRSPATRCFYAAS